MPKNFKMELKTGTWSIEYQDKDGEVWVSIKDPTNYERFIGKMENAIAHFAAMTDEKDFICKKFNIVSVLDMKKKECKYIMRINND